MLEWAGVLTWQHRLTRIQVRERDLFGRWASRWRVIRTSNAYVFDDPLQRPAAGPASKSENPSGTRNQEILLSDRPPPPTQTPRLSRPLPDFGTAVASNKGIEQGGCGHTGATEP